MPKDTEMQRTLVAEFPGIFVEWDRSGANVWNLIEPYSGSWRALSTGALGGSWVCQQDIDLTGYAMDKRTFYPYSSFEQRSGIVNAKFNTPLTRQPYVTEVTIVSSVPLNDNDLGAAAIVGPGFIYPGGFTAQQGRFNRDVIIHGQQKVYTEDSTLSVAGGNNSLKLVSDETYSSLEPTAADKLYGYKIITVSSGQDEGVSATCPSTRVLLPGNMYHEDKIPYMMRLKRSYELANQL